MVRVLHVSQVHQPEFDKVLRELGVELPRWQMDRIFKYFDASGWGEKGRGMGFDEFVWVYFNRRSLVRHGNIWGGRLRQVDPEMPREVRRILEAIVEHCQERMCLPHHIFKPYDEGSTGYIRNEDIRLACENRGIAGFTAGEWREMIEYVDPADKVRKAFPRL